MRLTYPFNDDWLFYPEQVDEDIADAHFDTVTLPHTNKLLPHHHFDDAEYQFVSTYRKRFTLPAPLDGRRLYIDFEGAMTAATVTINGHTFEEHKGGYTPFSYDITDYVDEDGENLLVVHLDSTERTDIPPFGHIVDYLTFGGLYREVSLRYVPDVHIHDVFVRTYDVLTDAPRLEVDVWIKNQSDSLATVTVLIDTAPVTDGAIDEVRSDVTVDPGETVKHTTEMTAAVFERWTLENPVLHKAIVGVMVDGGTLDEVQVTYGFREAVFKEDGFYLNGEHVQLRGLNRHQTFPYIGAAAPKRLQVRDADIIRYELGCNIVRTSHYPQSRHFLKRCDEIGLLVLEEIPGWQHIGDKDWQALSLRDVRVMIERDRNHPSIVLWGVRINESFDDTQFYTATNALAHELDPTRQTTGIRFWQFSEFLEDVFGFNDFSDGVEEPMNTPFIITEFNGHMFPTKPWDNEERRVQHALRHAKIQAQAATTGGISGAIGWCAFDYNTHKEFGSGDRICYHGVMDMFRLPKYAAYFYASQVDPSEQVVLQAATIWSMGDRSGGGNNPLTIFTNCDRVVMYIGEAKHGEYTPDEKHYPNLPHPPVKVTDLGMLWGQVLDDLHLVGYVGNEAVAEQRIAVDGQPAALRLTADDTTLCADGQDMTRIAFQIVECYGNPLPYANAVVTFEVDGPADLIGTNPFPLIGGGAALYLRARYDAGEVTITARTPRLDPVSVTVTLSPE